MIEFDDEIYNDIMIKLNELSQSSKGEVESGCEAVKGIFNGFYDDYPSSEVNGIKSNFTSHLAQINNLKSTINYSLLAYETCDNDLKDKANNLIDQLFDEKESMLAKRFKKCIDSIVYDDENGIKKYRDDASYGIVFDNLLPTYKYTDSDGKIWYYNNKKELIGISGNNAKMNYGGETFLVSFTENGALKLVDSDGNPINIFGDYNIDSVQYGVNQNVFRDHVDALLLDENIIRLLDQYIPNASIEEKKKYLNSIASSGCGYSSMANAIFKELEGREDKFLDTFGYQMYNIKMGNNSEPNMVDFNYEPVLLDLYNYKLDTEYSPYLAYDGMDNIDSIAKRNDGVYLGSTLINIFNRFNDKYHLFEENYEEILERNGYYSDMEFNLYYMNGEIFHLNSGGHVMTKIGELDDNRWIVSTYGQKLISEVNHPTLDWNYVSED